MSADTALSIRQHAPKLWSGIVGWCREIGIDWTEDDIAMVIGKVHAPTPDDLPDAIGHVLQWCRAAELSDDEEAQATVELWRTLPRDLIEITLGDDGRVQHRLNPDISVEITDA